MTMKKYLVIFLLLPFLVSAQERKDNTIIVRGVSFKQVVTAVLDKGFMIDKIDSNYLTLSTLPKSFENDLWDMAIDARVKDSIVVFTGRLRIRTELFKSAADGLLYTIEYRLMNNSPLRIAFDKIKEIALSLGGVVTYENR